MRSFEPVGRGWRLGPAARQGQGRSVTSDS